MDNLSPLKFFLIVYGLSIPFWILGFVVPDFTKLLPIQLPISALMTFCPLIAAVILVYKKEKMRGVKELLTQSYDFKKIKGLKWYILIIFLLPLMTILSYGYLYYVKGELSTEPSLPFFTICIFFIVYFVGAIGEEIGWSAYVMETMQNKYGAILSSIFLGLIWAIWHIIPWSQMYQTASWIFWQSISTVFLRVIMVWIFNNSGKSVFGMVLFHTMINISPYLIPNNGVHYDPFIFSLLLLTFIMIILMIKKSNFHSK